MLEFAFGACVVALAGLVSWAARSWRLAAGMAAWLALVGWLASSGRLLNMVTFPPMPMRVAFPSLVAVLVLAFSPFGARLADRLSFRALIGFQAFRIVVELFLAAFHAQQVIPASMTFHGRNFDILTGVSAIFVAWAARPGRLPRRLVLAWNIAGLLLLMNVVTIALAALPGGFTLAAEVGFFASDSSNWLPTRFPGAWILFFVACALGGHLLVFRKLNREAKAQK